MKKFLLFLLAGVFLVLASCNERDELRSDIDDLKTRVMKMEAIIRQMNADISNYQQMLQGRICILGYQEDEKGNYTVELSNGETITVYNEPDEDVEMPMIYVNAAGHWAYSLNGTETELLDAAGKPIDALGEAGVTPLLRVSSDGYWQISLDNGESWTLMEGNQPAVSEGDGPSNGSIFSDVIVEGSTLTFVMRADGSKVTVPFYTKEFYLLIKHTGTVTFGLNQQQRFEVEQENVETVVIENSDWVVKLEEAQLTIQAPATNRQGKEYETTIDFKLFSPEGYCRVVRLPVRLLNTEIDANSAIAWQRFKLHSDDNVLLDYSYAGYARGESAPPQDVFALGYQVFNVKERMEAKGLTARQALVDILKEKGMTRADDGTNKTNANARIVIYFPEGDYVLHNDDDNTYDSSKQKDALDSKGNNVSSAIEIYGGNFVIKGDGPGKTRILMETPNLPTSVNQMYSSPIMLLVKHTNSPNNASNSPKLASVTANAVRGTFTLQMAAESGKVIKAGQWVQLRLRSGDSELVKKEVGPMELNTSWTIAKTPTYMDSSDLYGVKITEFHQVQSVSGNTVTFYEPIMHDIDTKYNDTGGWEIREYKCFENVGVEDLTFVGHAMDGFAHHGQGHANPTAVGWQYDGAYKPLMIQRVVNSWVRNVNFESVSEALTIAEAANSSAYNIRISGFCGHSAVRAQGSSRIFIGKVSDESAGTNVYGNPCHGQNHGCGVSRPSMGTVLWKVTWGIDACFEAHATQPRATLFDNCSGGLLYYRAGGDANEVPNHLCDLTLWNLNVTGTDSHANNFYWWIDSDRNWKLYPPIVVGTHGSSIKFSTERDQLTYEESTGMKVTPESLYEAQLQSRLGYVPGWLNEIK